MAQICGPHGRVYAVEESAAADLLTANININSFADRVRQVSARRTPPARDELDASIVQLLGLTTTDDGARAGSGLPRPDPAVNIGGVTPSRFKPHPDVTLLRIGTAEGAVAMLRSLLNDPTSIRAICCDMSRHRDRSDWKDFAEAFRLLAIREGSQLSEIRPGGSLVAIGCDTALFNGRIRDVALQLNRFRDTT
jgi:hypothetical protein